MGVVCGGCEAQEKKEEEEGKKLKVLWKVREGSSVETFSGG